jgi:hypothetical protein
MKYAYRKLLSKFKKVIKENIKCGNAYSYLDKDDIFLTGYGQDEEREVYEKVIHKLEKHYKNCIEFTIQNHGYCDTYIRMAAKIIR